MLSPVRHFSETLDIWPQAIKYQIKAGLPAVLMRAKEEYSQLKAAGAGLQISSFLICQKTPRHWAENGKKMFIPRNTGL